MRNLFATLLIFGLGTQAAAHEYWFEAPSHQVAAGGEIGLGIFVGSDLEGQQMPYFPQGFRSLQHFAPGAEGQFISGRIGTFPALALSDLSEGLHVVAQETRDSRLTWDDPAKFEQFLRAEGIEYILEEHRARGLPATGFAESYSRSAKALVAAGNGEGADFEVGLPVELIALDNPFITMGQTRVLYNISGTPKADARVNLFFRAPSGEVSEVPLTTDADGIAIVPDLGSGFYLANAVSMSPVRDASPTVWHSSWASLTWTQ